jgi:C-terminal processing protease CtpA/Prc
MKYNRFLFRGGLALTLAVALLTGCKKGSDPQPAPTPDTNQLTDTREKAYQIALDMYLWYQNLPTMTAFNPKSYASPEAVLQKVRTYSPLNGKGTGNVDRWSFAITKDAWNQVTAGSAKGFGFSRAYTAADTNDLRVVYTFPNSPIGQAGVQRGWRLLKFNDVDATNKKALLDAVSNNDTGTFQFVTNTGETKTVTLTKAAYTQSAVLKRTVLDVDGKKVGYLMFNSFNLTSAQQELDDAFAYFKQNAVSDLVVDMRYNGGGSVAVAERFANYLVPASEAGKLMYTDQHNDKFKSWNRTKNFDGTLPANNLGLKRVVFLATGGTASASELLINVLKPHLDVKIVGDDTYGKPVGFYGIEADNYLVFAVAVKQANSAGYGDYYDGLPADRKQIDDITHDFGDPNEACMKDALTYLRTGSLPARMAARRAAMDVQTRQDETESFVGAIQAAPSLK